MSYGFLDIATTPSVLATREEMGSARLWAAGGQDRTFDRLTENEVAFIAARDSFYMASVSEAGWPYVQHRGGPPGFLKVIDDKILAFADFSGNRQYLSLGNLNADDRACLILMDYARKARLKIFAHAEAVPLDADPALRERVLDTGYRARPERVIRLTLEAFDWNCPQHITPRFTQAEIREAVAPLQERLAALELENASLRARLGEGEPPGGR